jgi:heat shock protein HtpX
LTGRESLYTLISRNRLKTFLFILLISLLLGLVGLVMGWYLQWGVGGYAIFGIGIVAYNLVLYFNSDRLALAISRAHPADQLEYRMLHNVVEEVAIAAGIPKPSVYIIDDEAPNAFATGRGPDRAAIAVTRGLLEIVKRDELQGVVAHEVAHIRNHDILVMTVVAIIGGLVVLFRDVFLRWGFFGGSRRRSSRGSGQLGLILLVVGLALALVSPLLVALIRAAVSRQREYLADASGAFIVRNPHGLASALRKLEGYQGKLRAASSATAHMFIASPFGKDRSSATGLFSTHPPIADRVKRLESLTVSQATSDDGAS